MATNDGYAPYPIGLTALQVKDAVNRAFNLSTELAGYVQYTSAATAPATPKSGDIWQNSSSGRLFKALVDDTDPLNITYLFFES